MIKVPDYMHCNTGECKEARNAKNKFFRDIKEYAENNYKIPEGPTKFREYFYVLGSPYPSQMVETDNVTYLLKYDEMIVISSVLETRDEGNWVNFTFSNKLSDLEAYLKEIEDSKGS